MPYNKAFILFRNIRRNKTFSLLNIFGLATGIACACFIFLWIENERSFNHQFTKRDNLFFLVQQDKNEPGGNFANSAPTPMTPDLEKNMPGIKNIGRITWENRQLFVLGDKKVFRTGQYADPSILSMLDFNFIYGAQPSLSSPESIIISESMSKALFNDENPVGKTIVTQSESFWSKDGSFKITGVFKDFPENSSFRFNWISPFKVYDDLLMPEWNKWNIFHATLVETEPMANLDHLGNMLRDYMPAKVENSPLQTFLLSIKDINLYDKLVNGKPSGGKIEYINLFFVIAVLILLIGCINFMNLSTARSEKRALEVGVRKVSGAGRFSLIRQFMAESLAMAFLSVIVAVVMIYLGIPLFNKIIGKELQIDLLQPVHFIFLLSAGVICGVVSGLYPSFYLSSFKPVQVLKGLKLSKSGTPVFMRKGLVILQFTISVILIIATITIYRQIGHIKSRNLGYDVKNMVEVLIPTSVKNHFPAVRNELLKTGLIENVAVTWSEPLYMHTSSDEYTWEGKSPNDKSHVFDVGVSAGYISTMKMKIKAGRDFYDTDADSLRNVIINETLAKKMGEQGKLGAYISRKSPEIRVEVIGIVEDFVFNDMYGSGAPVMIICLPQAAEDMIIRAKDGADIQKIIAATDHVLNSFSKGYPFEYKFVDEKFNRLFQSETLIGNLSVIFSVLAILVSCLGLFGLAAYTAEKRTKEIGIRKVLGASVSSLTQLLSVDFLKLVCISCVVAFPVAWWSLHNWLQHYQYRTTVEWWTFPLAAFIAILIAVVTVAYQAVKAAVLNPVKALRTE
ncbi:MAG: ABC transporter permease [Chitinophagaceae bacterium]|nr:ABC transporter permease [Chitinophagaceae bacterium]MCW5929414.1 ABC transporter permease [Chitinophagaceae bacterium]